MAGTEVVAMILAGGQGSTPVGRMKAGLPSWGVRETEQEEQGWESQAASALAAA